MVDISTIRGVQRAVNISLSMSSMLPQMHVETKKRSQNYAKTVLCNWRKAKAVSHKKSVSLSRE